MNTRRTKSRDCDVPEYLRGPIAWSWLHTATSLGGSALEVGLVLWHRRTLTKSTSFTIGTGDIARFLHVSVATVRRALDALVAEGLIQMDCAPGRKCRVTMIGDIEATIASDAAEVGSVIGEQTVPRISDPMAQLFQSNQRP